MDRETKSLLKIIAAGVAAWFFDHSSLQSFLITFGVAVFLVSIFPSIAEEMRGPSQDATNQYIGYKLYHEHWDKKKEKK